MVLVTSRVRIPPSALFYTEEVDDLKLKITFTALAIVFSLVGILILQFLAMLAQPEEISLDRIGDHEGETVVVTGVVAQYYLTDRGETVIKLAGDDVLISLVVETGECDVEPGDRIEVTGKIIKINNGYQIQVTSGSMLKKTGSISEEPIQLENIGIWKGEYVRTGGVISDIIHKDTYLQMTVFDPFSRFEVRWYLYSTDIDLSIGNEVIFTTFVDVTGDVMFLRTYMPEAVEIEGFWESKELGIRRAFESISANRKEFMYFPVNITGYVLYQPNPIFPGLTLSDQTDAGGRVLRINFITEVNLSGVNRRDLVKVRGKLVEDEKDMGIEMEAFHFEALEHAPPENIILEDIGNYPYLYEGAKTVLAAVITHTDGYVNRTLDDEATIRGFHVLDDEGGAALPLAFFGNYSPIIKEMEELYAGAEDDRLEISITGSVRFAAQIMGYVYEVHSLSASRHISR